MHSELAQPWRPLSAWWFDRQGHRAVQRHSVRSLSMHWYGRQHRTLPAQSNHDLAGAGQDAASEVPRQQSAVLQSMTSRKGRDRIAATPGAMSRGVATARPWQRRSPQLGYGHRAKAAHDQDGS